MRFQVDQGLSLMSPSCTYLLPAPPEGEEELQVPGPGEDVWLQPQASVVFLFPQSLVAAELLWAVVWQ